VKHYFAGIRIQQHPVEMELLEKLLNEIKPAAVCEIGTGFGALSVYFAAWSLTHQTRRTTPPARITHPLGIVHFLTIDITNKRLDPGAAEALDRLGAWRLVADCFDATTVSHIAGFLADRQGFIFCDGGNKTRELRHFTPMLKPGDVIAVHDWGTEVQPADFGQDWERENDLEPVMRQELQHRNCRIRAWKKKAKETSNDPLRTDADRR